ncbi:RICIN domain-containing protein [Nonomuraea sp. NEAU-A123]|uniref:RICIN domain-containing protein n=1 Tax=Nonomuraea sp. NEAU-A123 TaxID=2839649 RepID=UPI001BE4951E|nr:RICIN domain-containing protein [Nonomuraea sp. NEAU-A123]MBT2232537.1 hypothetical protein [Nonomuraea sp. NEAU-A123]
MRKTHQGPRRSMRGLAMMAVLLLSFSAMGCLAATATADSAQAPAQGPGVYRIVNAASGTALRAYKSGGTIFVSSTLENPGPFELWEIAQAEDGYTIKNVGLSLNGPPANASARQTEQGEPVVTGSAPTTWSIRPAGGGTFVIKVPNDDLLWNAEPPVIPRGDVRLRGADGSAAQRWRLELIRD